jgi:hypothetical protein
VSWIPFAKVEVAAVPVMLRYDDWRPFVKVEVPAAVTAREPVTARLVVVALVEVVLRVMRFEMVEDAVTAMPMVEVGESARLEILQSLNAEDR